MDGDDTVTFHQEYPHGVQALSAAEITCDHAVSKF
jgi:hypothetical protein